MFVRVRGKDGDDFGWRVLRGDQAVSDRWRHQGVIPGGGAVHWIWVGIPYLNQPVHYAEQV
jgi:hypothetical protein